MIFFRANAGLLVASLLKNSLHPFIVYFPCHPLATSTQLSPMKKTLLHLHAISILSGALFCHTALAGTNIWSGTSGTDQNWSTSGNWTPANSPGTNDEAQFFDTGATNATGLVNSIVTANQTIRALRLGQTNGVHNIQINAGNRQRLRPPGSHDRTPCGAENNATAGRGR